MVISVVDFTDRFKGIFGDKIWDDFFKYCRCENQTETFDSLEEVATQLITYSNKYDRVSNFYKKHKPFTRFVLICIERAYRSESRDIEFLAPLQHSDNPNDKKWEVEHIFPSKGQKSFDNIITVPKKPDSCPKEGTNHNEQIEKITKNSICNLTLISRELNGAEGYKNEDFQKKKDVMNSPKKEKDVINPAKEEYYEEKDFYINRIFQDDQATNPSEYLELLLQRKEELEKAFKNIFIKCSPEYSDNPLFFFRDVLGYSESEIQSTFPTAP